MVHRWPRKWKLRRRAGTPSKLDDHRQKGARIKNTLLLPEVMRLELKSPLGTLLEGPPSKTITQLKKLLIYYKPPLVAVVGDFTSKNIMKSCLDPDICVVDNRIMREEVEPMDHGNRVVFNTHNRPGTVNAEAWGILKDAVILKSKVSVIVEGEEDLLVLPLILLAPMGSIIVYGQPHKGMVVVEASEERKAWAEDFITRMEDEVS
jgi:uncharacterized protein (UPF0218 family)